MCEYGQRAEHEGWASWKANGMTCVDGSLYLSVSRHRYWRADKIQHAYHTSIVASDDYRRTWTAKPTLGRAMFPDNFFATSWFVDYGQNSRDAPDGYVYAVSNDGAWNNGNSLMLGRVPRERIRALELEVGEVALLHNWTLYGSDVNRSEHSRRAFSLCLMDAETRSAETGERVLRPILFD